MMTTRSTNGGTTTEPRGAPARRTVPRPPGLPGSRAMVGGLLVALAGVGTLTAWQRAGGTPDHAYAVATRQLPPGEPITADAVRFQPIDLPGGVAAAAFDDAAALEGRVTVAPVGEGELLQVGSVSDQGSPQPAAELSLALDRWRAVDGRVRPGDTVDVYATGEGATRAVGVGVRVIAVTDGGGSFSGGTELTVTLAVPDEDQRVAIVEAAAGRDVTLVRTTHVARRSTSSGAGRPGPGPPSPTTTEPAAAAAPGGGAG
jgi:Flp pilus assembly protein CpaB